MTTPTRPTRTAAEMNARLGAIGAELAKGRMGPVANAKELEREENALKIEYRAALEREAEVARDEAEIKARVEKAHREKLAKEREDRIAKAVAEATR